MNNTGLTDTDFAVIAKAGALLSFVFACYSFVWFKKFAQDDRLYPKFEDSDGAMMCLWTWLASIICGLSLNSLFWHKPWYWILLLFAVLVGPIVTFFSYDHPDHDELNDFVKIALFLTLLVFFVKSLDKVPR